MRKYLAAAALGAMLIAGQAAASDNADVSTGDVTGSPSDTANGLEGNSIMLVVIAGAVFAGLVGYGISQSGGNSHPISP